MCAGRRDEAVSGPAAQTHRHGRKTQGEGGRRGRRGSGLDETIMVSSGALRHTRKTKSAGGTTSPSRAARALHWIFFGLHEGGL